MEATIEQFGLIPIRNFGVILPEQKIFRSAQPMYSYEFRWLADVAGIKRIINLRSEMDIDKRHASMYGIENHTILVADHNPPTMEQVEQFKNLISNTNLPTLIHCEHGHGRTSTFSVLTKLAFGWTLEDAFKDEQERFHYHFKHHTQLDFLNEHFSRLV